MITHILFKGLNSFNIGSIMFRKILAIIIAVLIFSLVFLAVNFTKVEVPNFNRNLIMLAVVDIAAFGLVMWKFGCPMEKCCEEKEKEKEKVEVEVVAKEVAETEAETVAEEKEKSSDKTEEEARDSSEEVKEVEEVKEESK